MFIDTIVWETARALQARRASLLPPALIMTDRAVQGEVSAWVSHIPKDTAIILRDYDHPERETYLTECAEACRRAEIPFLVAGDEALAEKLGAVGVHMPRWREQQSPPFAFTNAQMRQSSRLARTTVLVHSPLTTHHSPLLTASIHHPDEISRRHADIYLVSPVFPTASHPEAETLGVEGLRACCEHTQKPIYALGGITGKTAFLLRETGLPIAGVAGVRLITQK